jgi:4-hydroxybenzoyl-CoA thioesterase
MANQTYTARRMIQFAHCDPAGIVFYPRFFDICLDVKEEFMEHVGFAHHHSINVEKIGWPIVRLECDFKRPCRYADHIEIDLQLWRLGDASMGLQYRFRGPDGERLLVKSVIVRMDLQTQKPIVMTSDMRAAFGAYLIASAA